MEITRKPLSFFKRGTNVRKKARSVGELRELGKSLRKRQLSPVWATTAGMLLIGYGRLDAAELEGLDELDVVLTDEDLTEADILLIQAQENMLREDLSERDRVCLVERLRELLPKALVKDLAEKLHVDPSTVTKLSSVSKVIPAVREAFEAGAITLSHVYQFSKLDPQQQHQLLPNALNGATREIIEQEGRKRRNGSAPAIRSSRITISLPSQTKVVLTGRSLSLAEVIECLTECLDSAKRGLKDRLDARTWQSVMRDRAKAVANA